MAVSVPVIVEPMRMGDIPAVLEIERLSFTSPWPAYAFEHELATNRLARYIVSRVDGRVVGFSGIWLMVDEAHITTFGVHPDYRRRGIGRRMLLRLAELSLELGAARLTLEVRVSNAAAQALYSSFGFRVAGRRPSYYSDNGEDAYIMTTPDLRDASMQSAIEAARDRLREADER